MNKNLEFKEFYHSELIPALQVVEKKRKGIINKIIVISVLFFSTFPGAAYYFMVKVNEPKYLLYVLPILIILSYAWYIIIMSLINNSAFYNTFKYKVIKRIIQFINPDLHYENNRFITKRDYINSNFFSDHEVKYKGDDRVTGKIGNVKIEFSELKTIFSGKIKNSEKDDSKYQFRGIFFVADFPKQFPCNLVIESNKLNFNSNKIFGTSNPQFDKYFQVRLTDEAYPDKFKELLTDDLLESIVQFHEQFHNDLHISFIDNQLYMGIEHDKDLFEPHLWQTNTNFDFIHLHFQDLYFPINFLNKLKLYQVKQD